MPETKGVLEWRENYIFTLLMTKVSEGKWEGKVLRSPHFKQQRTVSALSCGTLCHANSEDELKKQLNLIVNEYEE